MRARSLLAVVAASFLSAGCSGGSDDPPAPACDAGFSPCATGCCADAPPAGAVRVEFTWPTAGAPHASASRLEVILPDRTELLDAPATSLTLEGLDAGHARLRLRLLDGSGQVLARGGGVVEVEPASAAWLPISTDATGLSGCDIVDTTPDEDLVVDVSAPRTLTPFARDGWTALLLGPAELAWSAPDTGVASVDAVTGEVTPHAPGFTTMALRCGPEEAPSLHGTAPALRLAAAVPGPLGAATTLFVQDRTTADAAPVPRLAADPPAADADFTFRLDASATTDDGPAAALRWRFDWEGDGTWDTAFGARSVSFHKYQWATTYAPVVQVVDGGGRTARASLSLPVATPSGVRVAVDPTTDLVWLISTVQHQFTATVTGAADTSVTWSMLEGAPEVAGGCLSPTASTCIFDPPRASGLYHLVATPNADPTKKAMAEIDVRNQTPAADCHVEVGNGEWTDWAILGQEVRVDGSWSRDPERGPLAYAWWYQDGSAGPRIGLGGTDASVGVSFANPGARTLGLDVTDMGGAVGTSSCGTVTWAPAKGLPMGGHVGAAFWDDPDMTIEFVVSAPVAPATTWEVLSCTRNVAGACWSRSTTEYCQVEAAGLGAPYLACGSGIWFVTGPEAGAGSLWMGNAAWGWWPLRNVRGAGLGVVDVAVRGHSCLSGPLCP